MSSYYDNSDLPYCFHKIRLKVQILGIQCQWLFAWWLTVKKVREREPRVRVYLDLETCKPEDEGSFNHEDVILTGSTVEPVDDIARQEEEYKPFKNFEKDHEKRLQNEKEVLC